jgi:aspartyl-tRNA(Asn)/glutamyl-tRNA(Gln) amidotransferase subunit B
VEIKNLNSFKAVKAAVAYEYKLQRDSARTARRASSYRRRACGTPTGTSPTACALRSAHDYRYFPDPDLPPIVIDEKYIDD